MDTTQSLEYRSISLEDEETWKSELDREGFTVIRAVAGEDEVEKARALTWEWLESLGTGIKKEEPDTWTDEAWPDWPGRKKYGTCKSQGAAHLGATWYLRGLPRLKEVFTRFWGTEELIVSLDGMIIWRPWSEQEDRRPGSSKLHMDQNPAQKPGFHCVQGMLPLYPVTPSVGGTMVVPRSHLKQAELLSRHKNTSREPHRDYRVINPCDPLQGQEVLVPLMPGDLLLWDSRLVHCGTVGPGMDDLISSTLARASMCVSMGPRDKASREVLTKRKNAVTEGWAFSHWPWEARGSAGQDSAEDEAKYRAPQLSEDQMKLVGWDVSAL